MRRLKLLLCGGLSVVVLLATLATISAARGAADAPLSSGDDEDHEEDDETTTICQYFDDGDTCRALPDDFEVLVGTTDYNNNNNNNNNRSLAAEFFDVFRRLGVSWAHIIRSYKRIVREASGYNADGDVVVDNIDEALVQLRTMSQDLMLTTVISYEISFGKTRDDVLVAFLNWAVTNEAKNREAKHRCRGGINGRHKTINVSMAFRRLKVYDSWMREMLMADEQQHGDDDLSSNTPLSASSIKDAYDAFSMQVSHDGCGRLVWWMDLNRTDIDRVKELPPRDTRRFYTWLAHVMIFDENAQNNGVVFVNSLSDIGFWQFMTILPLELGIKTDEFMICVVPLNTKLVLFLERPTWVNFAYSILKVFLKQKMKRRVVMVQRKNQQKTVEHAVGGKEYIPDGFNGLDGTPNLDSIIDGYFEKTDATA